MAGSSRLARAAGRAATRPARQTWAALRDPKRSVWDKLGILLALSAGGLVLAAVGLLGYVALVIAPAAPSGMALERRAAARPSVVLAADGSELAQFGSGTGRWVPLDSVAAPFLDALLAVEDRRFYEHGGVHARRTLTAFLKTLAGDAEGGSTITQQLARNLYPERIGRAPSARRKLMEMVAARRIERARTKDEILAAYVNTAPFLYNAVGVERGARTYFGVSAADLTAPQAATLVAMLKGPSRYNPVRHPERARARRDLVLRQMAAAGALDPASADSLVGQPLGLRFQPLDGDPSTAPHFTRYVRAWLGDWAAERGHDLGADGLTIHTTLDPRLQRLAEAAVRERGDALQARAERAWGGPGFPRFWRRHHAFEGRVIRESRAFRAAVTAGGEDAAVLDRLRADRAFVDSVRARETRLEVGFVAIEPATGQVRAWVGSRDFGRTPFDHVRQARRQPGSTFKPFVYAAALRRGLQPGDTFADTPPEVRAGGQVWRPTNDGAASGRETTLTAGLAYSKNTVTARVMLEVGPAAVARVARAAGVRESPLDEVPSLALGTSPVTLLEMATAYGTLAGGGRYRVPVPVARIEDRRGRTLAEFGSPSERAIPQDVARTVVAMLRGAVERGTARSLRTDFGVTADVAGKTGTTQRGADGWFLAMHPDLVAGAWVGFPEPTVTFGSDRWGQGAHTALPVVGDFLREAQHLLPERRFPTPARFREPGSIWERSRPWWEELWAEGDSLYRADSIYFADSLFLREDLGPKPETPVQRLYEREGEDLDADLGRAGQDGG